MYDADRTSIYDAEQKYKKYKQTISYIQKKELEFSDRQRNIRLAAESLYRKIEPVLNLADHILTEEDKQDPEISIPLYDGQNGKCGISFRQRGTELPYIIINVHIENESVSSSTLLYPSKEIPYKIVEFPAEKENNAEQEFIQELVFLNEHYDDYKSVIINTLAAKLDFLTNQKIEMEKMAAREKGISSYEISNILKEAISIPLKNNEKSVKNRLGKIKEQERKKKREKNEKKKEANKSSKKTGRHQ